MTHSTLLIVPILEIQKEGTQGIEKIVTVLTGTHVNLRNDLRRAHHGKSFVSA